MTSSSVETGPVCLFVLGFACVLSVFDYEFGCHCKWWLESLSEMTYKVSSGTLNPAHVPVSTSEFRNKRLSMITIMQTLPVCPTTAQMWYPFIRSGLYICLRLIYLSVCVCRYACVRDRVLPGALRAHQFVTSSLKLAPLWQNRLRSIDARSRAVLHVNATNTATLICSLSISSIIGRPPSPFPPLIIRSFRWTPSIRRMGSSDNAPSFPREDAQRYVSARANRSARKRKHTSSGMFDDVTAFSFVV